MGPFGDLVGLPLDAFPAPLEAELRGRIDTPKQYHEVSLRNRKLPGLVVGYVELDSEDELPWLAVSVNGIISAITRPYLRYRHLSETLWAAVVPESSFVNGHNDIQIYALNTTSGFPVRLQHITMSGESRDFRGVALGGAPIWGVREHGFHVPGPTQREKPHRWTNGKAQLEVPVNIDDPPNTLSITLLGWGPEETTDLHIRVNGVALYAGAAPGKVWEKTLALDTVTASDKLNIEINSGTWGPNKDRGVLVQAITLQ